MRLLRRIRDVRDEIDSIYADPQVTDPAAASVQQRAELTQLRDQESARQTTVETVVEEQISTLLNEQGLALGGQVIPPVKFRFTPLPYMLIVSPRDEMYQKDGFPLEVGLTTDRAQELENETDRRFDVSSLVVPIGGLGIYPTMLLESTSLEWTIEAAAHEWVHNWLELRPLGLSYEESPAARTMNETTANLVGKEVGALTLRRFIQSWRRRSRHPHPAPRRRPLLHPRLTQTLLTFASKCTSRALRWIGCWLKHARPSKRQTRRRPLPGSSRPKSICASGANSLPSTAIRFAN
jgi:hypothetical protein